jgi:predicted nucleic acid-binding protein
LPFDSPTAEIAGSLADLARGRGYSPGFADIAIAATARRHDLTILSRNERHFAPIDVVIVDPYRKLPVGK